MSKLRYTQELEEKQGIIVSNSPLEVDQATDKHLGKKLVTNKTGAEGKMENRIEMEEENDN